MTLAEVQAPQTNKNMSTRSAVCDCSLRCASHLSTILSSSGKNHTFLIISVLLFEVQPNCRTGLIMLLVIKVQLSAPLANTLLFLLAYSLGMSDILLFADSRYGDIVQIVNFRSRYIYWYRPGNIYLLICTKSPD